MVMRKVYIGGSSHVKRFKEFINKPPRAWKKAENKENTMIINARFNLEENIPIKIKGWSGETLNKLDKRNEFWLDIKSFKPTVVILMIGSNDLCNSNMSPELLAGNLIAFAGRLKSKKSVNRVIFAPILPRSRIPFNGYNKAVHQCNRNLRKLVQTKSHLSNFISFIRFKGFMRLPMEEFYVDRIHLSPWGNKILYRNMRSEIIKALKNNG